MGVQLPSEPITRKEQYLAKAAGQAVEIPAEPITREEAYLEAIANAGGGGGGTNNYNQLENKPQIAGTTLQGNKTLSDLGIASATALGNVSDAVTAITDGQTINSFSDVETALTSKQNALTAGDYISLNNGNIAVNRNLVGDNYDYEIKSTGDYKLTIIKSQGGTVISTNTYDYSYGTSTNIDNNFTIAGAYSGGNTWVYTALKDSTTHSVGYTWTKSVDASFEETESFPSEDLSGYKLIIKSEMDTALSGKQDTLTFDDVPTANSNNPVKSGGVKSAIDAAVASAYHHAGTKTCVELVEGLLVAANEGNVYNMTDSGTTTADFIEGAGQPIKAGDNVGIAKISDGVYKFDLLSGFVDTTNFVQKSETVGLLKNDGTVDTTIQGDVSTLKSGLTNLDNEVNGDATVYPYADVITIEDAVPSNLADCSVKIEPVQNLHGYDKPWVGGAGKNKYNYVNGVINVASYTEGVWTTSALNGYGMSVVEIPQLSCEATDYVVSFDAKLESGTGSINLVLLQDDTGNTPASESRVDLLKPVLTSTYQQYAVKLSFSSAETVARAVVQVTGDASSAVLNIKNVQIEKGSVASSYAPYENICPITGHTEASVQRDGVNLFNMTDVTQGYLLPDSGEINPASENWRTSGYIKVAQNTEYVESGFDNIGASNHTACFYDKNKNFISGSSLNSSTFTFTTPSNTAYVKIDGKTADVTTIQLELGSSATDYEPFRGKTYTILFKDGQGNTVTAYRGEVKFNTGVAKLTDAIVDMGTLTYSYDDVYHRFLTNSLSNIKVAIQRTLPLVCECYETIDDSRDFSNVPPYAIYNGNEVVTVYIHDSRYTDPTDFTAAVNGMNLVYPLATPVTLQLDPTKIQLLQGTNIIYCSTGDISVAVNGVAGAIGELTEAMTPYKQFSFDGTPDANGMIVTTCPLADYIPMTVFNPARDGWYYEFVKYTAVSSTYWLVKVFNANTESGVFGGKILAVKNTVV